MGFARILHVAGNIGMRIAYFVSLFPCWSETFILREIHALRKAGHEITVFSLKDVREEFVQKDAEELLERGDVFFPKLLDILWAGFKHALSPTAWRLIFSFSREYRGNVAGYLKSASAAVIGLSFRRYLLRRNIEHIHAHWGTYPSTAAMFIHSAIGIPFSMTVHAHDIFLENHAVSLKTSLAKFVFVISEYNRRFINEKFGAYGNINLCHCGIEPDKLRFSGHREKTVSFEPFRFISVGRLVPIKGFPLLVEACGHLKTKGILFTCEIIGGGPLKESLEQMIFDHGLSNQVTIGGPYPSEQILEKISNSDMFLLPAVQTPEGDQDGIPVVLMESMALGTLVVTRPVSGIPELVEDGVTGFLSSGITGKEFGENVLKVLNMSHETLYAVRKRARDRIEEEYNIGKFPTIMEKQITGRNHTNCS